MAESKMKEVANILGIELGEKFKIKGTNYICRIEKDGLLVLNDLTLINVLIRLLTGEYEIEKLFLDTVEKRYLENLLRPFKDRVTYVVKVNDFEQQQYLRIYLGKLESFYLPFFEKNTMYKGMKAEKNYTLKELGLFEND